MKKDKIGSYCEWSYVVGLGIFVCGFRVLECNIIFFKNNFCNYWCGMVYIVF